MEKKVAYRFIPDVIADFTPERGFMMAMGKRVGRTSQSFITFSGI